MMRWMIGFAAAAAFAALPASAQDMSKFHEGPVFKDFGKVATVDYDLPIPPGAELKAMFDSGKAAEPGEVNRTLDSAGRFINMNVEAGVPEKDIHIAIVIHGPGGWDLTNAEAYGRKHDGKANASAPVVAQLLAHGVRIYICGQSATALGIAKTDLLPGVKMALSAMDADVLLQMQGYKLIP